MCSVDTSAELKVGFEITAVRIQVRERDDRFSERESERKRVGDIRIENERENAVDTVGLAK